MAFYESTFIVRQDLSHKDAENIAENLSKVVVDGGGKILKTEYWGLRTLQYPIKKNKKGHYLMLGIESPFNVVKELERRIKLNENIIRNLTVKVDFIDKNPSAIIKTEDNENDLQISTHDEGQ